MAAITPYFQQLKENYRLTEKEGFVETNLARVKFFWATETIKRSPLIYEAGIVIVAQGRKVGYLGDRVFHYGPDNYLVVSVSTPFECATFATIDEPLLGLFIDIDLSELDELVAIISRNNTTPVFDSSAVPPGVEPVALDTEMSNSIERLAKCLCSPVETKILGPALVKEIVFRALLGKHGPALFALTQHNSNYTRIAKALSRMRLDYAQPLTVDVLCAGVGMSASVFHRLFKQITGSSPLQYLKKIRLNQAKSFIIHGGKNVNTAAHAVGYESASQFSREFKRYFGVPPTKAHEAGYPAISYE